MRTIISLGMRFFWVVTKAKSYKSLCLKWSISYHCGDIWREVCCPYQLYHNYGLNLLVWVKSSNFKQIDLASLVVSSALTRASVIHVCVLFGCWLEMNKMCLRIMSKLTQYERNVLRDKEQVDPG